MITSSLKYQKYITCLSSNSETIFSYKLVLDKDLTGCDLVILYPNTEYENFFRDNGFKIHSDNRLSKNALVFSTKELLKWLDDDKRLQFDIDIPIKRFIFFF